MKLGWMLASLAIVACSAEQRADMESDKLDSFNLSPMERSVAEALIEGYKKEMGMPLLRSREYGRAACYAKKVRMPTRFHKAHLAYLANYSEADKDYYAFFAKQGLGEQDAYAVFEHFEKGYEQCEAKALIKERFGK